MGDSNTLEALPTLSPAQQRLKETVDRLANTPGGDTPDIVRQGVVPLAAGRTLIAEVLDPYFSNSGGQDEVVFALSVKDPTGNDVESVAVHLPDATTSVDDERGERDDETDGPLDQSIERFLERFVDATT